MKELYFISGLGADERVFQALKFEGYQPRHIHWIKPEPQEKIEHYAQRLTQQIAGEKPILVGLSFGGMMAIEISKLIATEKVILISSAESKYDIPPYYRFFKWLPLHRLVSLKIITWVGFYVACWWFGTSSKSERLLLKQILLDTDNDFFRWAIDQALTWENNTRPLDVYHIHGSADRVLPIRYTEPDVRVEQGGHLMVLNKAEQLLPILEQVISLERAGTSPGSSSG